MSDREESIVDPDEEYYELCRNKNLCSCSYSPKRAKTYPYIQIHPVFRTNAPALKDMASAVVAISLWNHVDILSALSEANRAYDYCAKENYSWSSFRYEVEELSSQLPIPAPVTDQIKKYISKVQNEITNWVTYHFRSVFLYTAKDYIVFSLVGDIIWHSDGTIDCKETAKNLLKSKSPLLNGIDKYNFLCTYCLKDEIAEMQRISPVSLSTFQHNVDFDQHPLIFYWNCHLDGKLDSIRKDEALSLDCFMFRRRYVDNWPAKEYFFDRLSPEDQIRNAIWLIDRRGMVYQKLLLMKLNESQRISMYLERSVQIITNYVKTGHNWTDVLETWSEVRHLITREQFVDLFAELLKRKATGSVLTQIWTNVDFDLKNHLLKHNNFEFIRKMLYSFEWTQDFNFALIVLQDLNADMRAHARQQFLQNFCEVLFSRRENMRWIDRLSDVFYGEDSKQFKQSIVLNSRSIKTLCLKYYSSGDLKALNDMLTDLFSQMPDRLPEYKINLLQSSDGMRTCVALFDSKIDSLNEIITDTIPVPNLAIKYRKELVYSTSAISELRSMLIENGLSKVKTIIDTFLTSHEDKKKLKKSLVSDASSLVRSVLRKYDGSYLKSLLQWVFEEDGLVKEFKKKIQVDDVFNAMLEEEGSYRNRLRQWLNDSKSFSYDSIDRFLTWYFDSPSEAKKYKIGRIYSYSNIDLIARLLKRRKQEDVDRLQALMRWFFENDAAEISKFNRVHKNKGKIARVL